MKFECVYVCSGGGSDVCVCVAGMGGWGGGCCLCVTMFMPVIRSTAAVCSEACIRMGLGERRGVS